MNTEIMNSAMVNYDALAERMSNLLNRQYITVYLLHTLEARAKASGYSGFAEYFRHEINYRNDVIEEITNQIIMQDKEIKFNQIDAIPNRGNKLIDLMVIYDNCIEKNKACLNELMTFAAQDVAMKIAIVDIVRISDEKYQSATIGRIKKMLSKAVNNYGVMLTIDKLLKDEYSQLNGTC